MHTLYTSKISIPLHSSGFTIQSQLKAKRLEPEIPRIERKTMISDYIDTGITSVFAPQSSINRGIVRDAEFCDKTPAKLDSSTLYINIFRLVNVQS